jgi:hypothetical protein
VSVSTLQRIALALPFAVFLGIEEEIRRELDDYRTPFDVEKPVGDTLVVAMSSFGDPKDVARFMKKAGADLAAGRDPVLARAIAILGGTMSAEQAGRFYR